MIFALSPHPSKRTSYEDQPLLNLAIWFGIRKKGLSVMHAVFGRFVNQISAFYLGPVLNLISTLNWFYLASLKLQHGGYLFNNEMMIQILVKTRKHIGKEVHQKHQERATSSNSNYKIKKAHWVCMSYMTPKSIGDVWISCFD